MQNNENEYVTESGFIFAQAGGGCYWVEDCSQPGRSCFADYQDCVNSGPWICVENCFQPEGCECAAPLCEDYIYNPCGSGGLVSYESCICYDCTKDCGGPGQPACPKCSTPAGTPGYRPGLPPCKDPNNPCFGNAAFPNQGPPPAAEEGAADAKRPLTCQNIGSMYRRGMDKREKDKAKECPNGKVKEKKTGNFYASCGLCFEDVEIVCCAKEKCKTLAEAKDENPCDDVKYQVKDGKRVLDDCGCAQFDFKAKQLKCPECKEPDKNAGCSADGNTWNDTCVPKTPKIICSPCENRISGCINNVWVERCDLKDLQQEAEKLGITCPDPLCWELDGGCTLENLWIAPYCVAIANDTCDYPCDNNGFPTGTCIDKHYIDLNARFSTPFQSCPAVCRDVTGVDCSCECPPGYRKIQQFWNSPNMLYEDENPLP
ncbi:hypothetical protein EBZ39_03960 [bacterium]|nr:hypothetical protein [bacterium]